MGILDPIIRKDDSTAQAKKVVTMLIALLIEAVESFATRTPQYNESRIEWKKSNREISIWFERNDSHYDEKACDCVRHGKTRKNTLGYRMVGYSPCYCTNRETPSPRRNRNMVYTRLTYYA